MYCQTIFNNTHVPTTFRNITRTCNPHIAKGRSYSCLLQLSNIMPLKTVPCAPSVQYPLPETCSCVSKCPAGISYLRTLVYQTSAVLLDPQCQVLRNFHLTEIAIHDSLWHWHCILFPTFYDLKSIQIKICIYPGKKHSWLENETILQGARQKFPKWGNVILLGSN